MVVSVNGNTYREPVDALYDYREEEDEDVLQAHLLREGEIGFSLTLRSPGAGSLSSTFFSPDTADGLNPCAAVLVLQENKAYDAVSGRTQVILLDWERNEVRMSFNFKMLPSDGSGDTLDVAGSVINALVLVQQ
jgi:hypothetical protein